MNELAKRARRYYSADFERQVVDACGQDGASVAAVALTHGISANLARRWLRELKGAVAARSATLERIDFVPIRAETPDGSSCSINLELRRGDSQVTIDWPAQAAHELSAWLQPGAPMHLAQPQFEALVLGLPWQQLSDGGVIRVL